MIVTELHSEIQISKGRDFYWERIARHCAQRFPERLSSHSHPMIYRRIPWQKRRRQFVPAIQWEIAS
jgi:hypothetical protein